MRKSIFVIYDGLGDRPIKEFGNKTPLEYANTPNMDKFAAEGECALMYTLGRGVVPGSDTAHLGLFGYAPEKFYSGRGPIEAYGMGLTLKDGDVAFRGNMGTVDDDFNIIDRRAGRIRKVDMFTKELDGIIIDGVEFIVKPGTAHRAIVIMRGKGLSDAINDIDPHTPNCPVNKCVPTNDTKEAKFTADVLNKFMKFSYETLKNHKDNIDRINKKEFPANIILLRGAGQYSEIPSFKERYGFNACCIAGGGLYKGVGSFLGMDIIDVEGATALPDTNVVNKFRKAVEMTQKYDFVFVHVKATDSLGEDGNYEEKKDFIEKIDKAFVEFNNIDEDTLLVVASDHSTPCEQKAHSADPVPVLFHGKGVRVDSVTEYNERSCAKGGLGIIEGKDLIPQIMNLFNKLHLYGA